MSATPYFPFYPSDYLADTGHLTTEQHGAYMLLLMQSWARGGALPNDDKKLARCARMTTRKWAVIRDDILEFFEVDGDQIVSLRLQKEHQKSESKSRLRADAGAKGGRAKALKDKKSALAKATVLPCHLPEPEPEPDITPSGVIGAREIAEGIYDLDLPGLADPHKAQGLLLSERQIQRWLDAGCDPARDILPTVQRMAANARGQPIQSWKYVESAVLEAKAENETPLTIPEANDGRSGSASRGRGRNATDAALANSDRSINGWRAAIAKASGRTRGGDDGAGEPAGGGAGEGGNLRIAGASAAG